ncbi:hypothetical protein IAT38_002628 [Cryptococcus sp. DSM 104549]
MAFPNQSQSTITTEPAPKVSMDRNTPTQPTIGDTSTNPSAGTGASSIANPAQTGQWTGPGIDTKSVLSCWGTEWTVAFGCCGGRPALGEEPYGAFSCGDCCYWGARRY